MSLSDCGESCEPYADSCLRAFLCGQEVRGLGKKCRSPQALRETAEPPAVHQLARTPACADRLIFSAREAAARRPARACDRNGRDGIIVEAVHTPPVRVDFVNASHPD
uniref:Uncharacterized protein n=1 Tax=Chrysotila carterae TaxID=13221 RepID=A0A7S4B4S1_CHRCT